MLLRAALVSLCALAAGLPACRRGSKSDSATVRGRVVDSDGHPLEAARVLLLVAGRAGEPLIERATVTDGRFALPQIPPGHYLLRAEARGFSPAGVTLALEPGETVTSVLRLEAEHRLTGMVQDRAGRPLGAAALFAWPQGGGRVGVVEASTGSDGRFALGLAPGSWTLMVEAPGFGTLRLERVNVPGRALVLRLEGEARSLGGMVVGAGGTAEAGARVLLGGNTLPAPRETRTDAKGIYLFHGLGLGRFVLRATQGSRAAAPRTVEIDERTGWLPPVRLELAAGGAVAGKVRDDRGQPLAGAEVELGSAPADELPEIAKTDAQGGFLTGPLAPGRYRAWARLPGHAAASVPQVAVKAGATATVELQLLRGAELHGTIAEDQGRPVTGATVTVTAADTGVHELAVLPGRLPPAAEAANLPVEALHRPAQLRTTTTDAQGRFQLAELSPGRVRIDVAAAGLLPLRKDGVVVRPGQTEELGRLVLGAGVAVAGRTVDEAGVPVGGARVEARPAGSRAAPAFFAVAGEDGRFTLQLPAGKWRLVAHAPRRAPGAYEPLEVTTQRAPAPVELRLAAAEATLDGSVRDPAGRPLAAATVSAFALRSDVPDGGSPAPADSVPLAAARTDGSGRFRLHGVPAAPLYVEARHPDWPAPSAVARPGEELVLQASRPGGVEGEVRDGSSGAFVNAYRLQASGPGGSRPGGVRTLGAGFELRGLAPGRWRLTVEADGYVPADHEVEVPAAASRNELSVHDVRVELLRPGAQARPRDAGPAR